MGAAHPLRRHGDRLVDRAAATPSLNRTGVWFHPETARPELAEGFPGNQPPQVAAQPTMKPCRCNGRALLLGGLPGHGALAGHGWSRAWLACGGGAFAAVGRDCGGRAGLTPSALTVAPEKAPSQPPGVRPGRRGSRLRSAATGTAPATYGSAEKARRILRGSASGAVDGRKKPRPSSAPSTLRSLPSAFRPSAPSPASHALPSLPLSLRPTPQRPRPPCSPCPPFLRLRELVPGNCGSRRILEVGTKAKTSGLRRRPSPR